jgi:hypothetical protein
MTEVKKWDYLIDSRNAFRKWLMIQTWMPFQHQQIPKKQR